ESLAAARDDVGTAGERTAADHMLLATADERGEGLAAAGDELRAAATDRGAGVDAFDSLGAAGQDGDQIRLAATRHDLHGADAAHQVGVARAGGLDGLRAVRADGGSAV